jgi:hypothetical protein
MPPIGDRWPDTLAARPYSFERGSTQLYLHANATARAVEGNLGGFAYAASP